MAALGRTISKSGSDMQIKSQLHSSSTWDIQPLSHDEANTQRVLVPWFLCARKSAFLL